jgi:NitT/TauT family transport system permease protein
MTSYANADVIPEITAQATGESNSVSVGNASAIARGAGIKTRREFAAVVLVAVVIIGGLEVFLRVGHVAAFIFPRPSAIGRALWTEMPVIAPHLRDTLLQFLIGYAIGASIGIILAGLITQFPFAEKIIAPYILVLVTTPMLALVPLLILNFGFGYAPRVIAVALASGPMVMINSATGFRRVDLGKIALARSYGASTLQTFAKIRVPMAMPMIIVGLMIGAIFGLLTTVGAEMTAGGFGLGSRLTNYSAVLRMPEFFAVLVILSTLGILIYVFFSWLGKKLAGWES